MDIEGLNQWLAEQKLVGYWSRQLSEGRGRPLGASFRPYLWKWSTMSQALDYAGDLVNGEDSFRRDVSYAHPDIKPGPIGGTICHTFSMGVQLVKPGELPPAHRHTMAAMRFVVEGSGAGTVVDGEDFPMEPGDLITTPSMTWHDHYNASSGRILWLDIVDPQVMQFLQIRKSELYPKPTQDIVRPVGSSAAEAGLVRPIWRKTVPQQPPPWRYAWADTSAAFERLAEEDGDPFDGLTLRYLNPLTGGPTLPTLTCEMQMLRPKESTHAHRHTSTVAYYAFGGRGRTIVNGEAYDWEQGDMLILPLWCTHHHENPFDENAHLFTVSDRAAVEALGLYFEEAA
jgi:1-hydroxy-2-naphthoate dioxygenase